MAEDCIFCKIVKREIQTKKIWEDKNFIAFLDAHPVGEGHTLIIPKKHFDSLMDLNKEISEGYIPAIKEVAKILMEKNKFNGFNIVVNNGRAAGQVVEHVHFHILPRREGDKQRGIFIG